MGGPLPTLASSLIYLTGLPKSNRESQSEQAKHLDYQIIFLINITVINKRAICTLGWGTHGGSVHETMV